MNEDIRVLWRRRGPVVTAVVMTVLALGLMVAQVRRAQTVRAQGELIKVAVRGYDPIDLLRGHYVALRTDWDTAPAGAGVSVDGGDRVWVTLVGPPTARRPGEVLHSPPADGLYFEARVNYRPSRSEDVYLQHGLQRFLVPEPLAPDLERRLLALPPDATDRAWLEVRVHAGAALPIALIIDDTRYPAAGVRE